MSTEPGSVPSIALREACSPRDPGFPAGANICELGSLSEVLSDELPGLSVDVDIWKLLLGLAQLLVGRPPIRRHLHLGGRRARPSIPFSFSSLFGCISCTVNVARCTVNVIRCTVIAPILVRFAVELLAAFVVRCTVGLGDGLASRQLQQVVGAGPVRSAAHLDQPARLQFLDRHLDRPALELGEPLDALEAGPAPARELVGMMAEADEDCVGRGIDVDLDRRFDVPPAHRDFRLNAGRSAGKSMFVAPV